MTMITPSYLGETIEYSSLHACRSTLEDPTPARGAPVMLLFADRNEISQMPQLHSDTLSRLV